jgi:hypothetical protein
MVKFGLKERSQLSDVLSRIQIVDINGVLDTTDSVQDDAVIPVAKLGSNGME